MVRCQQAPGLLDALCGRDDAAWECVKSFREVACVIVKHANPCGVAVGKDVLESYSKAFQTDPTSAFGGIIAFNRTVDGAAAQQVSKQFVEVLMAPGYTPEALEIFKSKVNVRVLQIELPPGGATDWDNGRNAIDIKRIGSGLLMQTADNHLLALEDLKVVTRLQPTPAQLQDLLFAWKVAKYVKSNAIVFCVGGMTMGVGAFIQRERKKKTLFRSEQGPQNSDCEMIQL